MSKVRKLPEDFLLSLGGLPGFDKETFESVHGGGKQVTSIRINPSRYSGFIPHSSMQLAGAVPWSSFGYYLSERPSFTFDPLFHAGCYYVQDASSMFLEQAFLQLTGSTPVKVLDLCGAPGGKTTHIQSLLPSGSLLVSNEVIKSRSNILIDNIVKWGSSNVIVTNNDPSVFSNLKGYFDVVMVDAPCSGSGLFRKDEKAIDEWSLNNVQLCSQRQQRILADVLPSLRQDGLLIYSTCSYSKEEDECIADWLVMEKNMINVGLDIRNDWNIVTSISEKTSSKGYRFYPDKVRGEGFFLACFKKDEYEKQPRLRPAGMEKASAKEKSVIRPWIRRDADLIKNDGRYYYLPEEAKNDFLMLKGILNIRYAGTEIGEIMKEKLVPAHALSLSELISDKVQATELDYENAIRYLQRQEMAIDAPEKGWQLVRFKGHNLGWINVLPNRINNYYPKEMRILKQADDSLGK